VLVFAHVRVLLMSGCANRLLWHSGPGGSR